ncbi:hypothetical protein Pmar_PMAR004863 [Perkinsus marinus ATCC 50983]|uniref:SET domain-containing protein n=1 Tax=Perkinsus marinus (strain ATCC 50983 / TXsc) TaxID=423536 RepID=C5LL83_PERM5|nr:hypothetical protein Pmar_PMAR004863 [Perkinsus marinus ATCC 50983]EER02500.1 hypothetical protein Pmar_PMAR004863 [Perkinsus marinus ATCC 50983]|eukprot:XP_002769782.1 hypothetical protein Pmar_PMAR004863 [Perkinsus marinus ATCC 50983]
MFISVGPLRTSTAGQGFMPTEAVTRDQSTKDVINFIIGEGAKVHPSLTLADMGTKGMGLVVSTDIKAGTAMITIPRKSKVLINIDTACDDPDFGKVICYLKGAGLDERGCLAFWLVLQKLASTRSSKVKTRWCPYAAMLPTAQKLRDHPLLLDDSGMSAIANTALHASVTSMKENTLRQLGHLLGILSALEVKDEGPVDTFIRHTKIKQLWLWAHAVLLSRSGFGLSGEPGDSGVMAGEGLLMIPLVDFANHDSSGGNAEIRIQHASTGWFGGSSESISLVAKRDIKAGEEILISYTGGDILSAEQSIFTYGFRMDRLGAPDKFAVPTVSKPDGSDMRDVIRRLVHMDVAKDEADVITIQKDTYPEALVAYMCIDILAEKRGKLESLCQAYSNAERQEGMPPQVQSGCGFFYHQLELRPRKGPKHCSRAGYNH